VDVGAFAKGEEEVEFFGEEVVVVFELEAEEGKDSMKEPRPTTISARPLEMRSRVEKF
jgi:hypothetical protein